MMSASITSIWIGLCIVTLGAAMEINVRNVTNHVPVFEGTPNNSTQDPPIEGVKEECEHGTFESVPSNCTAFVACNHGNRTEGVCPPNMWFDPNHDGDMLCNYPEIVCATDSSVCDCAVQYPALPADPLIETDVTCPTDNRFYFNSSRVDCGRYFVCFNGNVQRMECRPGFHYDPKSELCDYPEMVNCKIIDPACPAKGVGFLAHASRRDAFYFCFHGYKTLQSCAFYHVWDEATNSCRRRDEMNMF